MNAIPYHKVNQPLSRDRYYSFARYADGSIMLNVDSTGMTITLHLSKEDADKLKGDFNA